MNLRKILMISLALAASVNAGAYTTTPSETLKVWFDDMTFTPDGETVTYMHVYETDNLNYTAFNMTFILPKGLKVHMVKQGREMVEDIFLSERAASTHTISCNLIEDGTVLKVIADSSRNDDFYPDDEDGNPVDLIYSVGLIAEPDMAPGAYTAEMTGIKFVLSDGDASVPVDDHVYRTLTVTDIATGIEPTGISESDGECYDLLGRKAVRPQAGTIVVQKGEKHLVR